MRIKSVISSINITFVDYGTLGGNEVFRKAGKYEVYDKLKKITIAGEGTYDYTITGDKLTLKTPYLLDATSYEMKKSKKYSASDIKAKAK